MATSITTVFDPPLNTHSPDDWMEHAADTMQKLPVFVGELNALGVEVNGEMTTLSEAVATAVETTIPNLLAQIDEAVLDTSLGQALQASTLAQAARDSAFTNAKGAATISAARALVADEETFIVYGAGALTFDAYRRLSSTTQEFLGSYPTAAAINRLAEAYSNVVPNAEFVDDVSSTSGIWSGTVRTVATNNGIRSIVVSPATSGIATRLDIPVATFVDGKMSVGITIASKTLGSTYTSSAGIYIRISAQDGSGATISGAMSYATSLSDVPTNTTHFMRSLGQAAITTPSRLVVCEGLAVPSGAASVRVDIYAANSTDTAYVGLVTIRAGSWSGYGDAVNASRLSTFFDATALAAVEGSRLDAQNLFPIASALFSALPIKFATSSGFTVAAAEYDGVVCWKADRTVTGTTEAQLRLGNFPRSKLGTAVSAGVKIVNAPAATSGILRILLVQLDSAGAEITAAREEVSLGAAAVSNQDVTFEDVALDSSCVEVALWLLVAAGSASSRAVHFRDLRVRSGASASYVTPIENVARPVVYVASSGSDTTGRGTVLAPFASVKRALIDALPDGKIIVRAGDYSESVSIAGAHGLEIDAYPGEIVRFLNGRTVTGAALVSGSTRTYKATITSGTGPRYRMWVHDVPDTRSLIAADERHPLQRGETYRLPSYAITPAAGVPETPTESQIAAVIDASPVGTPVWYVSGTSLYFSMHDGAAPGARTVIIPHNTSAGFSGAVGGESVVVSGIVSMYGRYGFDVSNTSRYELNDCAACCTNADGVKADDFGIGIERGMRVAGSDNDGLNANQTSPTSTTRQSYVERFSPWVSDSADDGCSDHQGLRSCIFGGLLEYNGDRGLVPAVGAHTTAVGTTARKNGQGAGRAWGTSIYQDGSGFAAISASLDAGIGTQLELVNCLSENNQRGILADNGSRVIERNCTTRSNAVAGRVSSTSAIIDAYDGRTAGGETAKSTATGGVINVITTAALS